MITVEGVLALDRIKQIVAVGTAETVSLGAVGGARSVLD
jgi:hypothetical protein